MRNSEIVRALDTEEKLMADFIKRCLHIDPRKRMTCEDALRHEWFNEMVLELEKEIDPQFLL